MIRVEIRQLQITSLSDTMHITSQYKMNFLYYNAFTAWHSSIHMHVYIYILVRTTIKIIVTSNFKIMIIIMCMPVL